MSSFFKKRPLRSGEAGEPAKRQRSLQPSNESFCVYPKRIVAWNVNGLLPRLRSESELREIKEFVTEHKPDIIFLSEVHLPAANSAGSSKPSATTTWFRNRIRDTEVRPNSDSAVVASFLRCPELSLYKAFFSLADTKVAGTAMLINRKTTALPVSVRYNLCTLDVPKTCHHPEGRVILAKFPQFSILHTYSPNNGYSDSHLERRQAWDEAIVAFMKRKKDAGVHIMWIGDLNIAPDDIDLSHPKFFHAQTGPKRKSSLRQTEDLAQPGCTENERKRFAKILAQGDLVDAFRELVGPSVEGIFTWRGNTIGRYAGKGMRIDHCIVSKSLLPNVDRVRVTGTGSERRGFMGSDHSPVIIDCSGVFANQTPATVEQPYTSSNSLKEEPPISNQTTDDAAAQPEQEPFQKETEARRVV